jgi:hypothetical protein
MEASGTEKETGEKRGRRREKGRREKGTQLFSTLFYVGHV